MSWRCVRRAARARACAGRAEKRESLLPAAHRVKGPAMSLTLFTVVVDCQTRDGWRASWSDALTYTVAERNATSSS